MMILLNYNAFSKIYEFYYKVYMNVIIFSKSCLKISIEQTFSLFVSVYFFKLALFFDIKKLSYLC